MDLKLTKALVSDFEELAGCASAILGLCYEESSFIDLLTGEDDRGDLMDAFFFKSSLDEDMHQWLKFFQGMLGYHVKELRLGKPTNDREIRALLLKMYRAIRRINGMKIDREELVLAVPDPDDTDYNPFEMYGFEELEDKMLNFIEVYEDLVFSKSN